MARIAWTAPGSRYYEAGVDRGVLYVGELPGIPWVGLISVDENPTGAEAKAYYIDGQKYLNLSSNEEFEATIKAFTYPVEFGACDGTARVRSGLFFGEQPRNPFGFSYRTLVGNDTDGTQHGYKIHLVYDALATVSPRSRSSFSEQVEVTELSWNVSTKSRSVSGYKSTAHAVVDSRFTHPVTLAAIEDILYGSESGVARLPSPQELIDIFDVPVVWAVTDNEDGTFEVEGPIENVADIGMGLFSITHPSVTIVDEDSFTITY